MNDDYRERPEYRSLGRSRQMLVDAIIELMRDTPEWHRGWKAADVPVSMTGRQYRGENNVSLTVAAMVRGYKDPRWMTFNQMRNSGWSFKIGDDGKSMGRDAGVAVSFYELRDKKTKKAFDRSSVRELSEEERERYMRDNVYPLKKTYVVFNASIVDGVPALAKPKETADGKSENAEKFMDFWDREMTPIRYGGDRSCFVTQKNLIRLPRPEAFESRPEFYATAFHEISHSCQGFTRPGVVLSTDMGSPKYKKDELSAEISGVFLTQKLCGGVDTKALANSAAYLESWLLGEDDVGKMFFEAATEADKLCSFALETYEKNKREEEDAAAGAVKARIYVEGPGEQESFFDEAQPVKARKEAEKSDSGANIPEERTAKPDPTLLAYRPESVSDPIPRDVYEARLALLSPEDAEKMDREFKSGRDPVFRFLWYGGDMFGSWEDNASATLTRCVYVGFDRETSLRMFAASAQYDGETPPEKMEAMTDEAVSFVDEFREEMSKMNRGSTPHVKPMLRTHGKYGGK